MTSVEELKEAYKQAGQGHVFDYFDELNEDEKESLLAQLRSIKVEEIANLYRAATTCSSGNEDDDKNTIQPFAGNVGRSSDAALNDECRQLGLQAIRDGHVAALVLAGGQGTRLGYSGPKGMYNIGLPSQKSLFQLLVERLLKLGQLAAAATADADASTASGSDQTTSIPFYIMTSPLNHATTKEFFEQNNYFGAKADDVFFFQQGMLPCLSIDGQAKILMEGKAKVAMAPDGNGGIYPSLQASGALEDMIGKRGVKYLNVFSIDNALTKPADPAFLGYCIQQRADCGNKSVWKAHAHEKVGVVASRGGGSSSPEEKKKPCIVEYSEITKEMAEQVDDSGRLIFGAGNICNHFYTLDFLKDEIIPNMSNLYHVAKKKIPVYDAQQQATVTPTESNNGIKLEAFIFDVFPMAQRMAVWEVERAQEFAPVKNKSGNDSPDTARSMIASLAQQWLTSAGAELQDKGSGSSNGKKGEDEKELAPCCEVSPLTSYAGEGLERYKDQTVLVPFSI